jgi:RHS repeat-associated protein
VYVNALILRARDADNDGSHTLEERLYAMQDANYNVTGIVNTSGSVQERFIYDAYGKVSVKDASWANATDSRNWLVTYQGGRFNAATNLYYFDLRGYSPTMMRWITADPAGYVNGPNRYQHLLSNPLVYLDPAGLAAVVAGTSLLTPAAAAEANLAEIGLTTQGSAILTTEATAGGGSAAAVTVFGFVVIPATAFFIWRRCDLEAQKTQQYYDQQMAAEREGARVQQQIQQWKLAHPDGNGGGTSKSSTPTTTPGNYIDPQTSGGGQQPPSKPPTNTTTGQCDPDDADPVKRVTNPKHHPNSQSPEPKNVQELFDKSVPDSKGVRWAQDADGNVHRFSAPSNGESHWNGSTAGDNPIRTNTIPIEIRRLFGL